MRKLIYIFLLAVGLLSCERAYVDKPKDLLSKAEMVDVLTDLYINQQVINFAPTMNFNQKTAENSLVIFNQHKISPKKFEESYKYYFTNPKDFQKILDKVKENLKSKLSDKEKERLEVGTLK